MTGDQVPSPFPGMNPYLENPELWPEGHHRLITAIADAIAPPIPPKYRVAIEKRTYLSDGEDQTPSNTTLSAQSESVTVILPMPEEVREGYLEIREVTTGRVVTAIEVLSPTNKRAGKGRETYETKRREVLSSPTHLVEIDLLRDDKPMRIMSETQKTDYRILVSRRNRRPLAQLYAFTVRQEIPKFPLPLQLGDTEPLVDLQSLLIGVYERAGFDLAVDYSRQLPGTDFLRSTARACI